MSGPCSSLTGGHRVDLDALLEMVAAVCDSRGWRWAHARQPSAQDVVGAVDGRAVGRRPRPRHPGPPPPSRCSPERLRVRRPAVRRDLIDLLRHGQGVVATHHALAGWPGWEGWAEALGGRFHYAPGRLRGVDWPSSGTRMASYTARAVAEDHPVCAGITEFDLSDELYCCPVFEDDVVPLLRTDASMDGRLFTSTFEHVVVGEAEAPDCRDHPPASDLSRGRRSPSAARSSTSSPATRRPRSPATATGASSPTPWTGWRQTAASAGPAAIRGRWPS